MTSQKNPLLLVASLLAASAGGNAVAQATGDDPLFVYQWHLQNTGQAVIGDTRPVAKVDLDLTDLHARNIRGNGVIVGVVDDGLEIRHEDLAGNVVPGGSKNFVDGSNDPTPVNGNDEHGTAVTGIIGAIGWNGKGGRGVAPEARLKGFNFLSTDADGLDASQDTNIRYSWGNGLESKDVEVYNNSWGSAPRSYPAISLAEQGSWEKLMLSTRKGRGGIYVKAAGNNFNNHRVRTALGLTDLCPEQTKTLKVSCVSSSTDPFNNFIGTITVAAVNAKGVRSSYSSAGASIWVSGIGGEFGVQKAYFPDLSNIADFAKPTYYDPAIVTTDLSGCARGSNADRKDGTVYNALDTSKSRIDASCSYWARMNGTSAATPTVSGVVSLMLAANPKLSQRDVKYILASTARQIDLLQSKAVYNGAILDPGWLTNAAGHHFSNWYGFGLVDATEAVKKAQKFKSLPAMQDSGWLASASAGSPIGGIGNPAEMAVSIDRKFKVEAVQISFRTTHKTPANLRATLTSPDGTRSYVLTPFSTLSPIASGDGFEVPLTSSNAFLDETSLGDWKLQLTDVVDAGGTAKLQAFKIRVVGY